MSKIKIGDVFSIETKKGTVYFEYVYEKKSLGSLLKIYSGIHNESISIDEILLLKERFYVFFPLKAAKNRKIVFKVGFNSGFKEYLPKYMRNEDYNREGDFVGWEIVNTTSLKRKYRKSLRFGFKNLSPWGIWNDTLLIEVLESDFSSTNWHGPTKWGL